jgi:hypothetical protein
MKKPAIFMPDGEGKSTTLDKLSAISNQLSAFTSSEADR